MKRWVPRIGLALIPALVVGATLAIAQSDNGQSGPSTEAERDKAAIQALAPALPELVSSFRQAQEASDRIPGGNPLEALAQTGDARPGENPLLARRLEVVGNYEVYAWPATEAICYSWGGSSVCSPTDLLEQRGVLVGVSSSGGDELQAFALARDGIAKVEFSLANGRAVSAVFQDNAAVVDLPAPLKKATWTQPDGTPGSQVLPGG